MVEACLAYLWIIRTGKNLHTGVHRTDRCDLSLFQLGWRVPVNLLDSDLTIAIFFSDFSHAYPTLDR